MKCPLKPWGEVQHLDTFRGKNEDHFPWAGASLSWSELQAGYSLPTRTRNRQSTGKSSPPRLPNNPTWKDFCFFQSSENHSASQLAYSSKDTSCKWHRKSSSWREMPLMRAKLYLLSSPRPPWVWRAPRSWRFVSPLHLWRFETADYGDILNQRLWGYINGHFRILNWRYLPYTRPIFQAYVREYSPKIWPYMVQYLHFRILKFPLNIPSRKLTELWKSTMFDR